VALLIDAEKGMGLAGGLQGIDGDLHIALGGVFEAHWHGEPARHLAMDLTFAGARPNRCPGDQISVIVRRDGIEQFCPGRQAHGVDGE
jgi:hypothetical protein